MANEYRHLNSPQGAAEIGVENKAFHSGPSGPVPMEATIGSYLHNPCVSMSSPSVFNRRKQRLATPNVASTELNSR